MGKWKIVNNQYLYNIEEDRIESNDLSKSNPEKFQYMLKEFARRDRKLNGGRVAKRGAGKKNRSGRKNTENTKILTTKITKSTKE